LQTGIKALFYLMKNYLYHIRLFFLRFTLLILIFSLSRIIFYIFNLTYFESISFFHFLRILFAGIRFDISALVYFNLIFIILSAIPGDFKNGAFYQKVLKFVFVFTNLILLATNFVDTKFFDFESKRLTADFFTKEWLGEDFITLLPQFFIDFWYLFFIWFIVGVLLFVFYPKHKRAEVENELNNKKVLPYQILIFTLILGICLIGGRGGLQLKPLRVIHAAKYTDAKNIPLVLNSPFTIMKSIGGKKDKIQKYFEKDELDSVYSPIIKVSPNRTEKPNIVVIILESFSSEYIGWLNNGKGYTPFLDSLMNHSMVFTRAFANGKRSIESMPSIFAGIPALTDGAFITSKYSSNKINSAASLLKEKGYQTSFFHGGKNGTMGFNDFANLAGFDKYYGMSEYNNPADYDGKWGIYDEQFLDFFKNTLDEFSQPFLSSVYTLTSHHPYKVPENYKNRFPKGTLNIHEVIGYTDYALQKFFDKAKKSDWYKNTLFIITSDHTAQSESEFYNTKYGSYLVPIIFYHYSDTTFRGNRNLVAQQTDIFPTIMDYIGYDEPFICYGNSLLNDSVNHYAINYISGIYQYIDDNYVLHFDGNKSIALYNSKTDPLLNNNLINKVPYQSVLEKKIKAIIQSYNERLRQNQLTVSKK
jgi:phosphoglycerol transferase MdoB-like AlkP superfamily enzyme